MRSLVRALPLAALLFAGVSPAFAPAAFGQEHDQPGAAEHVRGEHAATAGGEHGEHGTHEGIDAKTLALQLVNFGVLLFILIKFAGGALNKGLRARHEQLKTNLEEANRLRIAAEARAKTQEARLANLEQEITAMRAAIVAEAISEKDRLLASADEKSRRIQADTKFQLEQQVKEAQRLLREEVASASIKVAEELLVRMVTQQDEQRLAQNFVSELGAANGPRAAGPDGHGGGGQPDRGLSRPPVREEVVS